MKPWKTKKKEQEPMGPSSPTYDVGTPTSDNEIQSMKGNEDSFGFNLDQSGCGQVPIIPLSGLAFISTTFFQTICKSHHLELLE